MELSVKVDIIVASLVAMLHSTAPLLTKISWEQIIYRAPLQLPNFPNAQKATKQPFLEQILHKAGFLDVSNAIEINFSIMNMVQQNAANVNLMCALNVWEQSYLVLHSLSNLVIW